VLVAAVAPASRPADMRREWDDGNLMAVGVMDGDDPRRPVEGRRQSVNHALGDLLGNEIDIVKVGVLSSSVRHEVDAICAMEKMLGHDQLHASGSGLNRPALSSCMANFGELAGAANCSAERAG
jgi:hypothetical protein